MFEKNNVKHFHYFCEDMNVHDYRLSNRTFKTKAHAWFMNTDCWHLLVENGFTWRFTRRVYLNADETIRLRDTCKYTLLLSQTSAYRILRIG
jgi:hypothetical protein